MGGADPIALSEMLAYMQIFQIDNLEDRAWFVALMSRLDGVYLEHSAKKQKLASSHDN